MLPNWALYLIIGVSSFILLVCLGICCCYVRRLYNRKKNANKVKKFEKKDSTSDRLKRYKYNKGKEDPYLGNEGTGAFKPYNYQAHDNQSMLDPPTSMHIIGEIEM